MAKPKKSEDAQRECLDVIKKCGVIKTANDFSTLMSALISDVLMGSITPNVCNAACNAGGKILKVVELQHKYGDRPTEMDMPLLIEK